MKHSQVFQLTRLRLAGLYASTMGIILTFCSIGFHEAMVHSHFSELNHRLESVAGTLHDGLEASLREPGQLEPIVQTFLPSLCVVQTNCANPSQHQLGVFQQEGYYIRFLDLSGRVLATGGQVPSGLPNAIAPAPWQTLEVADGHRYRQLSLALKTVDQVPWGYMQVGRSLQELDRHLIWIKVSVLIGLPTAMLLVVIASWWIAGQAMQPVSSSYRQMQQFTADAAHELRTPIAAIRATLESTLTPEATDAEVWEMLQTIERQNRRLSQLVQDLLLLSRIDIETLPSQQQPCILNHLASDLVEELAALAIAAQVALIAEIPPNDQMTVMGSEDQLYRLVANLMTNAIQYTPAGGKIMIHLQRNDHEALIQIEDTGIGISASEQARIFDRFYRVSRDRSRHTGGAGLGLAIAQAIAQAHQGSIEVTSRLGEGSLFTVRLPLLR